MILKMALRNILLHKSKTLIIGLLLVVSMVVMVLGNSLMDTAKKASEDAWIRCYAADLMIRPVYEKSELTMLGFVFGSSGETIRPVEPYRDIRRLLENEKEVAAYSPFVQDWVRFNFADNKYSGGSLMGVDPEAYRSTFPEAMSLTEGRFLESGEEGLLLTENIVRQVREVLKIPVKIGDKVNVSGFGDDGLSAKDLPLLGVFRYNTDNRILQMSAFTDLRSARHLASFGRASSDAAAIPAEASEISESLASGASLDDLFFDDGAIVRKEGENPDSLVADLEEDLAVKKTDAPFPDFRSGAFNYILVRLKEGADLEILREKLDSGLKALAPDLEVVTWLSASGGFVHMTEIVRLVFMILVLILGLVTAFVITNALLISIEERTVEIGTMRALGAQKSFVQALFLGEAMILSLGFGILGIFIALAALFGINFGGIEITDGFNAAMFGSSRLHPTVSGSSVLFSLGILVGIGVLSSLYPTFQALKLRPVQALGRSA